MSDLTFLVGTDGSEGSVHAMEWVAQLAAAAAARVVAVHAYEPLAHLGERPPPVDFEAMEEEARQRLEQEWCRPLAAAGVHFVARLAEGTPVGVLVDLAADYDADLIVVGARGLGTFRGMLLGSTSRKLSHASHRPVAIVPPPLESP